MIHTYKYYAILLVCSLVLSGLPGKAPCETNEESTVASSGADEENNSFLRDPFSPIGYVPPAGQGGRARAQKTTGPETGVETARPSSDFSAMLKIGGVVMKGGRYYATINGFTVQAGEVVTALSGGEVYKFIVEKIDLKTVKVKLLK